LNALGHSLLAPRRRWLGLQCMRNHVSRLQQFGGLWRHPDFLKLWAGQTVSLGGSLVSRVALPFVAILTLDASPGAVALLLMAELVPGIVIGLFAGVWVDHLRRRPLMIWTDLGRAVLLGSLPLAAVMGLLQLEMLLVVVFAAGLLTALFEVAYYAYLPTLVTRDELVEGNSKLEASGAAIEVASFGLGGWLVQVLTAPIAILVDAISFLVSAACLGAIQTPELVSHDRIEPQTTWLAIREGVRLLLHDPVLRALAGARTTLSFFIHLWLSMLLLFLTRGLGLDPGVVGVLFAVGGVMMTGKGARSDLDFPYAMRHQYPASTYTCAGCSALRYVGAWQYRLHVAVQTCLGHHDAPIVSRRTVERTHLAGAPCRASRLHQVRSPEGCVKKRRKLWSLHSYNKPGLSGDLVTRCGRIHPGRSGPILSMRWMN
jgi:hypothetical protein